MKMLLFLTILLSGLVAGLLFAYSCSVNQGLHSLGDREYIQAMQGINSAIQNPVFFVSFMGLLVLYPLCSYQTYRQNGGLSLYLIIGAMLIYFVAVFGSTALFNVPLNNRLAQFNTRTASLEQIALMRQAFEKPWNFYHSIRTIAAIIAFALSILCLLKIKLY
jgi:uncharacterized membrane protein